MDFSAFSHGQIHSKLWLCEKLEPHIQKNSKVIILASWYNILGMMLAMRRPDHYNKIIGIEQNEESINIANKICDAWMINNDQLVKHDKGSIHDLTYWDFDQYDAIINTSVEDISSSRWYHQVPRGKLLALQSNNLTPEKVSRYKDWIILDPNPDMETFKEKYHMDDIIFEGEIEFDYGDLKYSRYMLIGRK